MKDDWRDLAGRARGGDREAFRDLVERFKMPLCAMVHSILEDWHLTQDVAQDTFVAAWERIAGLREHRSFRKWLFRIARNRAVSRLRHLTAVRMRSLGPASEDRAASCAGAVGDGVPTADPEVTGRRRLLERVRRIVQSLPNGYGTALVMHHVEGMSVAELSEVLDRSPKAVKSLLYRARQLARDQLARAGLDRERVLDAM